MKEATAPGRRRTIQYVQSVLSGGSTSPTVNWTTTSERVPRLRGSERCGRCGGRVVGAFSDNHSCVNCGHYPMDYRA